MTLASAALCRPAVRHLSPAAAASLSPSAPALFVVPGQLAASVGLAPRPPRGLGCFRGKATEAARRFAGGNTDAAASQLAGAVLPEELTRMALARLHSLVAEGYLLQLALAVMVALFLARSILGLMLFLFKLGFAVVRLAMWVSVVSAQYAVWSVAAVALDILRSVTFSVLRLATTWVFVGALLVLSKLLLDEEAADVPPRPARAAAAGVCAAA